MNSQIGKNMENFNEKTIIERIKLLRTQHAGARGKSKFARALGISPSTYNYYENDRVAPIKVLLRICEVTGADLEWLLTGQQARTALIGGPNKALLQQLDELLTSSPELAEPIQAFVELLCEKKGIERQLSAIPSTKTDRPGWIPVLGRTAAGMIHFWDQTSLPEPRQAITELDDLVRKHIGKTIIGSTDATVAIDLRARALVDGLKNHQANLIQVGGAEHEQVVEFVQCQDIHSLFPDSFALQIDGDSMSPRINDGDIVIVSPSVSAAQGQIGVARLANQIGVTCKLIRATDTEVHLIPINERYETKVVPKKDLLWALAVLCHISQHQIQQKTRQ
jgi:transcriptional regulator with XRE-family HTH domain